MDPNDLRLVVQRGINLTCLGDPTAAIPWIEQAMPLDPFSADRYYLDLVRALFMAERAVEAIEVLERMQPTSYEHYVWLAACCAATNEDVAAPQAGKKGCRIATRFIHLSLRRWGDLAGSDLRMRLASAITCLGHIEQ